MYIYLMLWAIFITLLTSTAVTRNNLSFIRVSLFVALLSIVNFIYTKVKEKRSKE